MAKKMKARKPAPSRKKKGKKKGAARRYEKLSIISFR